MSGSGQSSYPATAAEDEGAAAGPAAVETTVAAAAAEEHHSSTEEALPDHGDVPLKSHDGEPAHQAVIPAMEPEYIDHDMTAAPENLFSESMPAPDSASTSSGGSGQYGHKAEIRDLNFAARANEMINAALGRTPAGTSVVDPDSVLDDSGRLYHGYKDGAYFLPNDAAEQDRLDLQHKMFEVMLDGWLALSPMSLVPRYVLDVATGTGIWATEWAEKYPSSFVIGTDLSAIQPDRDIPNCVFQKDDAEAPWLFPAPHPPGAVCSYPCQHNIQFDFIHLRMVCTCFDDTQGVIQQAYDNLAPGGWIEFQDFFCDTQHENNRDSPLAEWYDGVAKGAALRGRDLKQPMKYHAWLEKAGFVDVTTRELVLPCNPWPKDPKLKEAGAWQLRNFLDGIQGVSWRMMAAAGYTAPEIEASIEATKKYLLGRKNNPFFWLYVVYGRKPYNEELSAMGRTEDESMQVDQDLNDLSIHG